LQTDYDLAAKIAEFRGIWARTEFPGEVFEQDLLFRVGQLSTAAWISESVLMRGKVARPVHRR
jgi:hypothetical protein